MCVKTLPAADSYTGIVRLCWTQCDSMCVKTLPAADSYTGIVRLCWTQCDSMCVKTLPAADIAIHCPTLLYRHCPALLLDTVWQPSLPSIAIKSERGAASNVGYFTNPYQSTARCFGSNFFSLLLLYCFFFFGWGVGWWDRSFSSYVLSCEKRCMWYSLRTSVLTWGVGSTH